MKTIRTIATALPLVVLVFGFLAPVAASAALNTNVWNPTILQGPLVTCVGSSSSTTSSSLPPCQSLCDLIATVANVIYFMIGVVIWIIAPILIAWAGILFMISRGNTERSSQARKMITGIVIGLLITLCAYLIVEVFVNVLGINNYIGGFGASACPLPPSS